MKLIALFLLFSVSLSAFQRDFYRSRYDPRSGYLTSTITWSYADGYYVVHPNDNLFYYPFPSDQWRSYEREIAWVTYDDPSWERGYSINHKTHKMKENGLALMATCVQDLRRSFCHDRKWIRDDF